MASNVLTKSDYIKTSLRAYFIQNGFNYGNYQGLGYANMLYPALRKMYKDDDDALQAALQENLDFYNTNIHFVPFITSLHLVMLENGTPNSEIRNIKMALMGPLAGIGDSLSQFVLAPLLGTIGASLAYEGLMMGPIIYLLGMNIVLLLVKLMSGMLGYNLGTSIIGTLTYYKGKPFLVDSGRYTYREDDPLRLELKAPAAHNVCVIDGQSGGTPDGSWSYADYAETGPNYFAEEGGAHYVEMPFHGTLRDGTPYQIIRRLMVLDEGVWLSVQDVICRGEHQVREYFHLAADVQAESIPEGWLLRSGGAALKLRSTHPFTARTGILSPCYNEKQDGVVLVGEAAMRDRWTGCTLFVDKDWTAEPAHVYQAGSTRPLDPETVSAWTVRSGSEKAWTLLVWNRENFRGAKVFDCQGQPVYGKAVVLCGETHSRCTVRLK